MGGQYWATYYLHVGTGAANSFCSWTLGNADCVHDEVTCHEVLFSFVAFVLKVVEFGSDTHCRCLF